MAEPPKLVLDAMLGKLACWLRLLGYDALFVPDTDDIVLVRIARGDKRLLITRDGPLARNKAVEALFIEYDALEEQLQQVLSVIGPPQEPRRSRCGECNTPLDAASKDEVADRVPPYVLETHDAFQSCPNCHRVYWKGTHWQGIEAQITTYLNEL